MLRADRHTESPEGPAEHERRSRRALLGGLGAAAFGAVAVAGCGGDDERTDAQPTTATRAADTPKAAPRGEGDLKIVNYALTLEYFEVDFYGQVLKSGEVNDKKIVELMKHIEENEQAHVEMVLKAAKRLGKPARAPKTKFDQVLAGGQDEILKVATTIENLGSKAYLGQAAKLDSEEILAVALSIHTVESRQAAALNELAARGFEAGGPLQGSIPDGPFAKPMDMPQVLAQIQPYLA